MMRAALRMLGGTRLRPRELQSHLLKANSPEYWRSLNPRLRICSRASSRRVESRPLPSNESKDLVRRIAAHGFINSSQFLSNSLIHRMRRCVETVRKYGWPPVFAFVYDEFWLLPRAPSIVRFLGAVLGREYRQLPHLWCHYITPRSGHSGWSAHVDGPMESGRLSLWFPLSDATLENGCMYVIPKDRLATGLMPKWASQNVTPDELKIFLQGSHALPAPAGSVLGWEFGLIHWGSTVGMATEPRISFSLEFIAEGIPRKHEKFLIDHRAPLPGFEERLRIIGNCLLAYQKFEPGVLRFADLAERLRRQPVLSS
jgi:hypothetical protein